MLEQTLRFEEEAKRARLDLRVSVEPDLGHDFPADFDERLPAILKLVLAA